MAAQKDMWGKVGFYYRTSRTTELISEHVAGFLLQKHSKCFELGGTGDLVLIIDFVVAVALATQESKELHESADEYVLRLQNRLMNGRLLKPK